MTRQNRLGLVVALIIIILVVGVLGWLSKVGKLKIGANGTIKTTLQGMVIGENGAPLGNVSVSLKYSDTRMRLQYSIKTDTNGDFQFAETIDAGKFLLTLNQVPAGYQTITNKEINFTGGDLNWLIQLYKDKAGFVTNLSSDSDLANSQQEVSVNDFFDNFGSLEGKSAPNTQIILSFDDTNKAILKDNQVDYPYINLTSDGNGRFSLDKIPVGKYSISSIDSNDVIKTGKMEIVNGQKTGFDFSGITPVSDAARKAGI